MAKKLGILMIRGSGSPGFDDQEMFIERLFKQLRKEGKAPENEIAWRFINWYEPLETEQQTLISRLEGSSLKVRSMFLRKFLLSNTSDLINYGGRPNESSTAYEEIHQIVTSDIRLLQNELVPDAPLIILASSFGTKVINDHIWDRQQFSIKNPGVPDPLGQTAFERMETVVGLFTFGSNLAIFGASVPIDDLRPIQFPDANLPIAWKPLSKWINIYDKNDPLGYPVTFINQHYADGRVTDVQCNVGNIFTFWNIASHFYFWKSKKVGRRVCKFTSKVLDAI
ncbi:MAG: hypothetical protein R8G66_28245 [Cytophagales bacterium]|nr:hypothetical protein [Cytophagales bacterium]